MKLNLEELEKEAAQNCGDFAAFCDYMTENKVKLAKQTGNIGERQMIDLEVSVRYTDCIRVIRMNLENTLYDLHRMIQQAVSFDDGHLYEFSVGTGMMKRVYRPPEAMNSVRELSVDTSLNALDLQKGQKLSYLFDFGDRWQFDIKVLEIREGTVRKPEVIRAVGEAPGQYPFYEEDEEGWEVVISEQVQISYILSSVEEDLIRSGHAALTGLKSDVRKGDADVLRREMEQILLRNPDRMLMFMTDEMRKMLSQLLQEEWIDNSEGGTLAQLCAFGFCQLPKDGQYEIMMPAVVKEVYASKIKAGGKYDKIVKTAELVLRRCGVMEMEVLYSAITGFLKRKISYEDFKFLIYSRLHYFGSYYSDCLQQTEYMSCYDREITQRVLEERQKPENYVFDYPDFTQMDAKKLQEAPEALQDWNKYVEFHLEIDWRIAEALLKQIPAMAVSGVFNKEETVAAYKKILRGTGSRVTKKAEDLIGELLLSMPLATRKGNIRPESCMAEENASGPIKKSETMTGEKGKAEKTKAKAKKVRRQVYTAQYF